MSFVLIFFFTMWYCCTLLLRQKKISNALNNNKTLKFAFTYKMYPPLFNMGVCGFFFSLCVCVCVHLWPLGQKSLLKSLESRKETTHFALTKEKVVITLVKWYLVNVVNLPNLFKTKTKKLLFFLVFFVVQPKYV